MSSNKHKIKFLYIINSKKISTCIINKKRFINIAKFANYSTQNNQKLANYAK